MNKQLITIDIISKTALVIMDRPEKRNAFNEEMWEALRVVTQKLAQDLPRAIVLTGADERAFSAGFDVNPENKQVAELINAVQAGKRGPALKLIQKIRGLVDDFVSLPVPIIAAINGNAFGGGAELASRCDIRVIDPAAEISFSETKLGLMPDWGGGVALTNLVGRAAAAELVLTGRRVTAEEAFRIGLANRISTPGKARDEALALAGSIAHNGPHAVRAALRVIRESTGMTTADALNHETDLAASLIATGECMTGITAFLQKKEPEFPDPVQKGERQE